MQVRGEPVPFTVPGLTLAESPAEKIARLRKEIAAASETLLNDTIAKMGDLAMDMNETASQIDHEGTTQALQAASRQLQENLTTLMGIRGRSS